jgi:hypothetical protein
MFPKKSSLYSINVLMFRITIAHKNSPYLASRKGLAASVFRVQTLKVQPPASSWHVIDLRFSPFLSPKVFLPRPGCRNPSQEPNENVPPDQTKDLSDQKNPKKSPNPPQNDGYETPLPKQTRTMKLVQGGLKVTSTMTSMKTRKKVTTSSHLRKEEDYWRRNTLKK